MRIAYCDDEITQTAYLKELVREWEQAGNPLCEVTTYGSAEEMLFENPASFPFDFIILDIQMDKMNGMELARAIRQLDPYVALAFLSNSRQYVFEGYEVQAVRYLLKPLTGEQLFPLLEMVRKQSERDRQYIIVGKAGDKVRLDIRDIYYIEAFGHYVNIHTEKRAYEVKININEIYRKLNTDFIPTHRSFLVNLRYVERITRTDCILRTEITVPISRNSYKDVNQAFIRYYREGGFE